MTAFRSAMFRGHLVHVRRDHIDNRFRYPICFLGLDLDELPLLTHQLRLLSHNRANAYAVHDTDYEGAAALGLRGSVTAFLEASGSALRPARIHLVTQPRVLGYVFNPVSFFLCYDAGDELAAVIAEVNNNFGGRHRYMLDDRTRLPGRRGDTFASDKVLFVSPFIHGPARYEFEFRSTERTHDLRMRVRRPDEAAFFTAQLVGDRMELGDVNLARLLAAYPLMTLQITGLIHWQALRVWRMGGTYRRPAGYVPSKLTDAIARVTRPLRSRLRRDQAPDGNTTSSGA